MLGRIFQGAPEERAVSYQTLFSTGASPALTTPAGVSVNEGNALRISTVYACVRLIADSISTLPVDAFFRFDGQRRPYRPRPVWLDYPESGVTRTDHFQMVLVSLLLNGNAFVRVLRDDAGVVGLDVLNPTKVQITRNPANRRPEYIIDESERVGTDEMIHIAELRLPGEMRGKSRIDLVSDSLGLHKALDLFAAKFFGSGAVTSGIIEYPGNLTREQASDLKASFEQQHQGVNRAHKTGILFGGAKYQKTGVDPDSAQMLASREHEIATIARVFRVPVQMLGVTTPGAQSYASVEMNMINFVVSTLRTYIVKLEDAYSRILPGDVFLSWNINGLLRGDSVSRMNAYGQGLMNGVYSVNDVRRLEDLSPVDGGDVYRVPLANVDLAAANLSELDRKTTIAQKLINSGFDPTDVLAQLGLPPITHSGVPSVQLQNVALIDPEDPEAVYDSQ
jgi:HK97 family phage portal protein